MKTLKVIPGTPKDVIDQYSKQNIINQKQEIMKSLSKITDSSHTINADLETVR